MLRRVIRGNKVVLSKHASERTIERLKSLGICYENEYEYYDAIFYSINEMLTNKFMDKYISNMMGKTRSNRDILVHDTRSKMVFALGINTYTYCITIKTIGTEHEESWRYSNDYQRMCWIYEDTFKFSTINGNVTWY